jgi:hypothetical protein
MLAHHRKSVRLSFISTDLPIWSVVNTEATLDRQDDLRFHLLLTESRSRETQKHSPLVWLEISPYRVIMTRQAIAQVNYRHFWERGVYGTSRYWLNSNSLQDNPQFHLRNFTRSLTLEGRPLPQKLCLEYELWSEKLQLGRYVLNLEIQD